MYLLNGMYEHCTRLGIHFARVAGVFELPLQSLFAFGSRKMA
jgi:hypothetical protein